jgi:hypothetical protein
MIQSPVESNSGQFADCQGSASTPHPRSRSRAASQYVGSISMPIPSTQSRVAAAIPLTPQNGSRTFMPGFTPASLMQRTAYSAGCLCPIRYSNQGNGSQTLGGDGLYTFFTRGELSLARIHQTHSIHYHIRQFRSPAMIRITLVILFMIATSQITSAGDPTFADRYFSSMEDRKPTTSVAPSKTTQKPLANVATPQKKISKKPTPRELALADQARHRGQRVAPPKLTFDGVHYWNEQGECVAMKTHCKPCRIGR